MNIQTKFHGEKEINTDEIIKFSSGIPGFLDAKEFIVLPIEGTDLYVLQSIRSQQVAFIITDPFLIFPQYEFDLTQEAIEALEIQSENEVATFVILTVKEPFQETTANLQAPVIINLNGKLGKQIILTNTSYTIRHRIVTLEKEVAK